MWEWLAVGLALVVGATVLLEVERINALKAEQAPIVKVVGKIQAWNRVHLRRDVLPARQPAKRR